jgi:DHA1 family purine ribonucleoside efflux pump-like MFS transporter
LGGFWSLSSALVVRLVSMDGVAKGMAVVMAGVSLSSITAPPLGAVIAEAADWRAAFFAGTGIAVIALLANIFTLPRLPATDMARLGTLTVLLRRRAVQITLLGVVCIASAHFGGLTYIRPLLETVTKLNSTTIAEVLLGFGIANFVGNLANGTLVDRHLRPMMAINALLIAVAALCLAVFGADLVVAAIAALLWGFGFGGSVLGLQTYGARAAPDHLEAVGGLFVATFQISIATGAAVGGVIVDHSSVVYVMVYTGVMACGAAVLATIRPKF